MKSFKDLEFKPLPIFAGLQAVMNFDNGYGVSVVKFIGSYGYEQDLWEIGILYGDDLTYNTHITDDVIGYQTEQNVSDVMEQVQSLSND